MQRCNSVITDLWQSICRNLSAGSNKSPANLACKKARWLNLAFTAMIAITIAACGAGGGGALLVMRPPKRAAAVSAALTGCKVIPFRFEPEGARVVYNGGWRKRYGQARSR